MIDKYLNSIPALIEHSHRRKTEKKDMTTTDRLENKSPIHTESLVKRIWINDNTEKKAPTYPTTYGYMKLWKFSRLFRHGLWKWLSINMILSASNMGEKEAKKVGKLSHDNTRIIHAYHLSLLVNERDYSNFLYTWNEGSFAFVHIYVFVCVQFSVLCLPVCECAQ